MTHSNSCPADPRRRRAWLALLVAQLVLPLVVGGQAPAPGSVPPAAASSPRLTCWRGQPLPACKRFVLTELGFMRRVVTTGTPVLDPNGVPYPGFKDEDYRNELLVEVGVMQNRGARDAIGGVLVLGPNVGAKVRYRRWLDSSGMALDLGAGVVRDDRFRSNGASLVGDAALNFSDYGALIVRGQTSRRGGRQSFGLHAGARLGSKPAAIGGAVLTVAFGVLLVAFASAWND